LFENLHIFYLSVIVVRIGIGLQAISIACAVFILYTLLELAAVAGTGIETNIFVNWQTSTMMIGLCFFASLSSLSGLAMDISVEKEWVPTAIHNEENLVLVNTRMRSIFTYFKDFY
jgi:hypothetical protein